MKKLSQTFTIGTPSYQVAEKMLGEWKEFYKKSRSEYDVAVVSFIDYLLTLDKETEKMFSKELE